MRILLVEDEVLLARSIKALLESRGFCVDMAHDGEEGKAYAELRIYDLLILDVMLPKLDGFELSKMLRNEKIMVPILMLTAKSEVEDRVRGLNSGADYYLTKPFDFQELLACVQALLRRQGGQINECSYGNTTLDLETGLLACGDKNIRLSAKEFEIMRLLLQSGEKIIPKENLLTRVWGYDTNAGENNVEVYVGFLRKKLVNIGSDVRIEAVRRMGYHLMVDKTC